MHLSFCSDLFLISNKYNSFLINIFSMNSCLLLVRWKASMLFNDFYMQFSNVYNYFCNYSFHYTYKSPVVNFLEYKQFHQYFYTVFVTRHAFISFLYSSCAENILLNFLTATYFFSECFDCCQHFFYICTHIQIFHFFLYKSLQFVSWQL